jgi:hypothetical protein
MFKHWKKLLLGAGMTAYFLGLFTNIVADPDLWGYLAFGRLFWESGSFPFQDIFSYIPTKETWVYHEWLTGVLFFPIHRSLGPMGLQLLKYALILTTIGIIYKTAVLRGGNVLSTLVVIFLMANAITYGYSPVRAQVFTYFFFSLTLYILERYKKEQRSTLLLWLLPIHLIWCNVHGGFLAGLGIIGLYATSAALSGQRSLAYVLILIASSAVTFINPYGIDYWIYTLQAVSMPRPEIFEWMSVPAAIESGKYIEAGILFISILVIAFLMIIRHPKRNLTDIFVLTATAYLGFKHIRHSIFFFLAFGAYMPIVFTDFLSNLKVNSEKYKFLSNLFRPALAIVILLFTLLSASSFAKFILSPSLDLKMPSPYYPVGGLQWIKSHQWKGNILSHFEWGEFLIWNCYPACLIGMDGRFETVFEMNVHQEYFDFLQGRNNWKNFLEKYPHDMVLLRSNSKTDILMRTHPSWKLVYEDTGCALFLRKERGAIP